MRCAVPCHDKLLLRRTLDCMADSNDSRDTQATRGGPSWGLMLLIMLLAMLAAVAIAWAFITPALHPH